MVRFQGAHVSRLWLQSCLNLESHGSSKPAGPLEGFHVFNVGPVRAALNFVECG